MFFFFFFGVFVFGREEKKLKNHLGREKKPRKVVSSRSDGCLGLLLALTHFLRQRPLEGCRPQKVSNWVDLDILRKISLFSF